MSYKKSNWVPYDPTLSFEQNVTQGGTITADKLNNMETGIDNAFDKTSDTIGGRNLLLGTATPVSVTGNNSVNQVAQTYTLVGGMTAYDLYQKYGSTFTLSYDWSVTDTASAYTGQMQQQFFGTPRGVGALVNISSSNTSGHMVRTFTLANNSGNTASGLEFRIDNVPATSTITVSNTKLEKGSIATDWTPAPEDKVNVSDMRKPASDVAGIEEVNAKQDKIGYTPADDSKVVHSTVTQLNSTDMNTVLTAGFYQLNSGTNGMPNADAWTIYQVIPLASSNGVQIAYETNNVILGMRSWNYSSGALNFTNWIQLADDSKVVHNSGNEEIGGKKTFDVAPIDKTTGKPYITNVAEIEVTDYAPTRDGNSHTLSESYVSIDEARKDYPAATSLADTKDWCAITEAIQEGQNQGRNIYLAPGKYVVNKTVTLPTGIAFYGAYQNSIIFASTQMSEDSKNAPIAILEYDGAGQPPIYVENIQVIGTSDQTNQLIGLHLGGNRASKISNFVVSQCFGHGTLVYPTHPQSADVENTTFDHYWQIQSGSFCIKSNASIDRGNITDFAVYDSQITTLDVRDENQSNTSSPSVEIINEDNKDVVKTIYGIEFTRCFLHAQGNNLVRVVGCHLPRATHSINFDFIKGELHDIHGDLGPGSDKFFLFHLENCWHIMVDHSSQLIYSGASYVEIKRCAFCDIRTAGISYLELRNNNSMIFTLDTYSYENHINLIGMDVYLTPATTDATEDPDYGIDFGEANDAMDLFSKMSDNGSDNHITGWQIGQTLTLNNEPQRLAHITNGKIDGLSDNYQNGVTSSLIPNSVHTKHVMAKGTAGPILALPIQYNRTSGFLISFRAIGSEDDLKNLNIIAGSRVFQGPTDQNWHVWTGICKTNILNAIGIQAPDNVILSNDVTLEIEYLDCFMENKIPYYPDFIALPMPIRGEGNY